MYIFNLLFLSLDFYSLLLCRNYVLFLDEGVDVMVYISSEKVNVIRNIFLKSFFDSTSNGMLFVYEQTIQAIIINSETKEFG